MTDKVNFELTSDNKRKSNRMYINDAALDHKSTPQPKKIITPDTSDNKSHKIRDIEEGEAEALVPEDDVNKKELLIMTIEIGDGQQDTLYVYEDDDPYSIAHEFVTKHNLNENIISPLSQNIYNNMEQVLKERVELLDQQSLNFTRSTREENGTLGSGTAGYGSVAKRDENGVDLQDLQYVKIQDKFLEEEDKIKRQMNFSNTLQKRQTSVAQENFEEQVPQMMQDQYHPEDLYNKEYNEAAENNPISDDMYNEGNYQQADEIKEEPYHNLTYSAGNMDHSQYDKQMKFNGGLSNSDYIDYKASAYMGPPFSMTAQKKIMNASSNSAKRNLTGSNMLGYEIGGIY